MITNLLLMHVRAGLIALCADPLGLRSIVHALAINNPKLQELCLGVLCELLRINAPRGAMDPFRQSPHGPHADEGNKSMISDFDLVSRTRCVPHPRVCFP